MINHCIVEWCLAHSISCIYIRIESDQELCHLYQITLCTYMQGRLTDLIVLEHKEAVSCQEIPNFTQLIALHHPEELHRPLSAVAICGYYVSAVLPWFNLEVSYIFSNLK